MPDIAHLKICENGHKYYHSSDCPVCPSCWPNFHQEHGSRDFDTLSAPAQRALYHGGIKDLVALSARTEKEILGLHGMGPKGIRILKEEFKKRGLGFAK